MIRECGSAAIRPDVRKIVCCTLPIGHGGVHANRVEKLRAEVSTVGVEIRKDLPTVVFETKFTWISGGQKASRAIPHRPNP